MKITRRYKMSNHSLKIGQPAKIPSETKSYKKAHTVASRPLNILKLIVHCPTFCYYTKVRTGKGFLQELKALSPYRLQYHRYGDAPKKSDASEKEIKVATQVKEDVMPVRYQQSVKTKKHIIIDDKKNSLR
uniref:Large ribosomal subunit protein eL13 n=1 Tax=Vespula pensylvanica TaxID=30213 RepID=A0A834K119_VESPE|nr:hypothetical protein H0235_016311 [Vespula pensylvanica]